MAWSCFKTWHLCSHLRNLWSEIAADVLSEEAILKWYKEAHVAKGKSVFLDQMKKFVEWLQNAEEGMIPFNNLGGNLTYPFSLYV